MIGTRGKKKITRGPIGPLGFEDPKPFKKPTPGGPIGGPAIPGGPRPI